jgi:hypothetical protein
MAKTNLLLLEGPDDIGVLYHLLERYQIPVATKEEISNRVTGNKIVLENGQGAQQTLSRFKVILKMQDDDRATNRLGIILDADLDLAARWRLVQAILRESGYISVPDAPAHEGTILQETDRFAVGIWLMPDNRLPGELEHFVRFLISENDRLWLHAENSINLIPAPNRLFNPSDTIKAQMHTWLAWQKEPGKPMGQAIQKRFLDADVPQVHRLIAWIRRLFFAP